MAKIKITKDMNEYKPGKFAQFSLKGYALAAQKLNKNGLLLWLYLCDNKNGFILDLSPTAISNELGVTIDVAKAMTKSAGGMKELINAGFIKDGVFYAEGYEEDSEEQNENSSEKTKPSFEF